MKKLELGIVIDVNDDVAKVKVGRHNSCKSCGACPGDKSIILDVQNPVGAKPGDRVCFEIIQVNVLKAAYVVYAQPIIAAIIGAVIGYALAVKFNQSTQVFGVVFAVIFFVLSFVYIRKFDKSVHKDSNMQPTITKILS